MLRLRFRARSTQCGVVMASKRTTLNSPTTTLAVFAAAFLFAAGFCCTGSAFQAPAGHPGGPARGSDGAHAAVEALSLAYVPRDAAIVAAFRPSMILNGDAFVSLNKFLSKRLDLVKLIGISLERVRQLTVVFMLEEGPSFSNVKLPDGTPVMMNTGKRVIAPDAVAVILHLARLEDVAAIAKALAPESEESRYAGKAYVRAKSEADRPTCLLADDLTVVIADEAHLRRLIVAGRASASKAKWTQAWKQAAGSDFAALANVTAIRNLVALKMKELGADEAPKINPPSAAPLFDSETALLTVDFHDQIVARLQLAAERSNDLVRIHAAVKALIELGHVAMSDFRASASSNGSEQGAELLGLIETLDATLDSVEVVTQEHWVEAAASMSMDDANQVVASLLAVLVAEDDNANVTAPQPAPAEM